MREDNGIACIPELAEHLLIGEDLARLVATELEQAAEQRRFVDAGQEHNVARDRRFDQGINNVAAPPLFIINQGRRAGIATEIDVLFDGPAESGLHFGVGPVRDRD